jgi:hypothetical protein
MEACGFTVPRRRNGEVAQGAAQFSAWGDGPQMAGDRKLRFSATTVVFADSGTFDTENPMEEFAILRQLAAPVGRESS